MQLSSSYLDSDASSVKGNSSKLILQITSPVLTKLALFISTFNDKSSDEDTSDDSCTCIFRYVLEEIRIMSLLRKPASFDACGIKAF